MKSHAIGNNSFGILNFSELIKSKEKRDVFFILAKENYKDIRISLKGDVKDKMLDCFSILPFINRRFSYSNHAIKYFEYVMNEIKDCAHMFKEFVYYVCECFYREGQSKRNVGHQLSLRSKAFIGFLVSKRIDDDYIFSISNVTFHRIELFYSQYKSNSALAINYYLESKEFFENEISKVKNTFNSREDKSFALNNNLLHFELRSKLSKTLQSMEIEFVDLTIKDKFCVVEVNAPITSSYFDERRGFNFIVDKNNKVIKYFSKPIPLSNGHLS